MSKPGTRNRTIEDHVLHVLKGKPNHGFRLEEIASHFVHKPFDHPERYSTDDIKNALRRLEYHRAIYVEIRGRGWYQWKVYYSPTPWGLKDGH